MLRTRVIPCLLLSRGSLVKTVRFQKARYVGDPLNTVRIFNEKEVDELLILDIDARRRGEPVNFRLIEDIAAECFMPLSYGGAVQGVDDVDRLVSLGVEKVALNTPIFENPDLLGEIASTWGSQSVIASLDVKRSRFGKYSVVARGGTRRTNLELESAVKLAEELGAGEILLTSVDRDGTYEGFDLELVERGSSAASVPVVACGGAGSIRDLAKAAHAGASGVAAGSLFVYQSRAMGVLINFPSRDRLEATFSEETS